MITGTDEERNDIFDQTKRKMREYLGNERAGTSAKGDVQMKEEVFENVREELCVQKIIFTNRLVVMSV